MMRLDRFTLKAPTKAAESAGGSTYLAAEELYPQIQRPALIELFPTPEARDQQAISRLQALFARLAVLEIHPHLLTLLGIGITEQTPWAAFEYQPITLAEMMTDIPTPAPIVMQVLAQIATALDYLHQISTEENKGNIGLLHHNLHPANIYRTKLGQYKLGGLIQLAPRHMEPTLPMHMVRFAAPELLQRELGPIGPATDLYALGHLACLLALGKKQTRAQFPQVYEGVHGGQEGNPAKWMQWHCSLSTAAPNIHKLLSDFPEPLSDLISRLMLKTPGERIASAQQLLNELNSLGGGSLIPPPPIADTRSKQGSNPSTTTAPAISPDNPVYFVRLRGKTSGPFDLPTLQRQVRQGLISRLHQVSSDQVVWRPAAMVEGLFGK